MISTNIFKKLGKKDPVAAAPAPVAAAAAPGSPGSDAKMLAPSAESAPATGSDQGAPPATSAAERPAPTLAGDAPRAARLVEFGPAKSSKFKARLVGASAKAEPWGKTAAVASLLLAAGALGYAGGLTAGQQKDKDDVSALRWSDAAAAMKDSREETARVASELKFVRIAVETLKGDRLRNDINGKQAQLSERLDRNAADLTARFAKLSEQMDRVEKTQRDPARIGALVERLERIEKHVQTAAAMPPPKPVAAAQPQPAAAAPADVTHTGSLPDPRPPAKPAETDHRKVQVDGFVLRDIDDGLALIEARNGRYYEVSPGMMLPGLGKVEAIERRGRQWVVVTPKGYIGER